MAPHATSNPFSSIPTSVFSLSVLSTLLLTFPSPSKAWDCKDVLADKVPFNFGKLGGPHVVHWEDGADWDARTQSNYNFTLDICSKLKTTGKEPDCHPGTLICAKREDKPLDNEGNSTIHAIDIAGNYKVTGNGRSIDAKTKLIQNSESNADAGRKGVRVELHGGKFPFDAKNGLNQRAIIEFVCDPEREGTEGLESPSGEKGGDKKDKDEDKEKDKDGEKEEKLRKREDQCEESDSSLRFCGYKLDKGEDGKDVKTLRLDWRTKYACEGTSDDSESSHWGFFAWFIIILFLATAAYLIFGSWLNYNRYGARGWDLLPHGDTIRDIPYIMKDWARNVKDSLQGSGSRGGYSAV